jgi:hypothetical protein
MGKFKHDGSTVDTSKGGGYEGEQPKPGVYPAKLVICEEHTSQSSDQEGTHWVFELTEDAGPYAGWRGHTYTNDAGALWKQDQILVALGLQQPGGRFEGTHEGIVKKGGPVRVRTNLETYDEEKRAKIRTVLAPEGGAKAAKGEGKKKKKSDEPF